MDHSSGSSSLAGGSCGGVCTLRLGELPLRRVATSASRPCGSANSSRGWMWEAGKIPMKTCCDSSVFVAAFDVDGSADKFIGGLRDVQTT